ncbi:LDH1 [Auxenochlorella protothecoides x Auxenochlorella symbiontica]
MAQPANPPQPMGALRAGNWHPTRHGVLPSAGPVTAIPGMFCRSQSVPPTRLSRAVLACQALHQVAPSPDTLAQPAHGGLEPETMPEEKIEYKVAVFSSSEWVTDSFTEPFSVFSTVNYFPARLEPKSAKLAAGHDAVCIFVNDDAGAESIAALAEAGVKLIALRCAGFDRVDLEAAEKHGIRVVRVPAYSPRSVAEHALTLMMALARNLKLAQIKVQAGSYTLNGLVGLELTGRTFGIVGTGAIGLELVKLLRGFEGKVLAYDPYPSEKAKELGVSYVPLEQLMREADVVSLHVPLLPSTRHIIGPANLKLLKPTALVINVSRGGLIDTSAAIASLTDGNLGGLAVDVYEGEESLFFKDMTNLNTQKRMKVWDKKFNELLGLPQVIVTPHIAFLTTKALDAIASTTRENLAAGAQGRELVNEVKFKG